MISKKTVAAVGAGAVAGALGISLAGGAFTASASPASPSAAASAAAAHKGSAAHKMRPGARRGLGRFAGTFVHGSGVVKTKTGFETLAVDRGTVSAVSPTTVSIKSADGVTETFTAVATSKFRVDGKKSTISGVKVGATASTIAVVNGSADDIKLLVVRPAKAGTGA